MTARAVRLTHRQLLAQAAEQLLAGVGRREVGERFGLTDRELYQLVPHPEQPAPSYSRAVQAPGPVPRFIPPVCICSWDACSDVCLICDDDGLCVLGQLSVHP